MSVRVFPDTARRMSNVVRTSVTLLVCGSSVIHALSEFTRTTKWNLFVEHTLGQQSTVGENKTFLFAILQQDYNSLFQQFFVSEDSV